MSVRVDKWLQVARVFKTRSHATKACTSGRVKVNDRVVKAHKELSVGDRISIRFGNWNRKLIVLELRNKLLPKKQAAWIFEDISPPRPVRDPLDRILQGPSERREAGSGRPTKRDRRLIGRLKRPSG